MRSGLAAIENSGLPGKYKAWCMQFALFPRILWPLQIYDIPLTPVQNMEHQISMKLRKWLGVPRCFNTGALYANTFKLALPFKSLVEEYKVAKTRLATMLLESKDPVIRDCAPDLNTGRKWDVMAEVRAAVAKVELKEVIGAVQTGKQGVVLTKPC